MNPKQIIERLTLYSTDLYTDKIHIIKHSQDLYLKKEANQAIQTDAVCWKKDDNGILFKNYNYVLCRSFFLNTDIKNYLYYNIDNLKNNNLNIKDLFPIYPNCGVLTYYLDYYNMPKDTKVKCLDYAKSLNPRFYR